ncbi:MAG: SpoIIE family protein phosphatase [Bacteroidia bacterium]|nr:SpoIIE family protein phosphatase [Bacteroidia bacterium]
MRKIFILIVLLIIDITLGEQLFAQQYNFRTYSIENGLPQNDIYEIIQDSRGYIWLGTYGGGACRFDGTAFTVFNKKKNLAGNVVRCIIEDNKKNIWFGTDEGLSLYNGFNFRTISTKNGLSSNTIISLFQDSKGNIWAGTSDGGINRIQISEEDSVYIKSYTEDNGLTKNMIFCISEDVKHRLWLGTFGGGINILDFSNENLKVEIIQKIQIPSNHILAIRPDKNNNMWIGSFDGGAFKIIEQSGSDAWKVEFTKLNNMTIWDILFDNDGSVWFATNENGLIKYQDNNYEFFTEENGLPNNQILCLYMDNTQNLWAGTMGSGTCMFMGKELIHYSEKDGLSKSQVMDIIQDKHGYFWLGTYGSGLYKCNFESDSIVVQHITTDHGLISNSIMSLSADKNNNIWIGTAENGVCMFDGKYILHHFTVHQGLPNNDVNSICIDSEGIVWLGTIGGITMFDGVGTISMTQEDGLINNEVQTIIEDKHGIMWYGTLGGLANAEKDKMITFDEAEGLYDKKINALAEDKYSNIWLGTFGGGLYRLNRNTKDSLPIQFIADDRILSSNNIYSLIFENDYTLIVGTNKGFDRISLDENMNITGVKNYGLSEGFIGGETKQNAIYLDKNGNIWFGTVKGVTKFSPAYAKSIVEPPVLHITGIKLFFENIDWKEKTGEVAPWFSIPEKLSLRYSENHLTFEFTGISYSNPQKILFKYMLEGVENEWSPPRREKEVVYSGLSPGDYTFKLIAANENNVWSKEPVTFSFTIRPPFWKTTWFIITCIVVTIVLIILYIKLRERKLVQEKEILEQKVRERTAEIQQQKEEIEAQRDEIQYQRNQIEKQLIITSEQRDQITEQRKEILDSIHYAQRIQQAILPPEVYVNQNLPEHFILFRPKDIVSGDFHWTAKKDELMIVAAADCTGHGVPGAFMSMLGVSFLNQIIIEKGVTQPSFILNLLRANIIKSLQQKGQEGEAKDGMDIALCTIDLQSNKLQFAGANNPLYYFRNNELTETKGDKMPVAIYVRMEKFTNHEFEYIKGDTLYVFSDGFADQFGGPKGKKFKYQHLKDILLAFQEKSMTEQKILLNKAIEDWMAGDGTTHYEQIDDICIIGVRL